MSYQYPLVVRYDDEGRPDGLKETNYLVVSSISAADWVGLPVAGGSVSVSAASVGEIYFRQGTNVVSGIPLPPDNTSGYLNVSTNDAGVPFYSWGPGGTGGGGGGATTLNDLTDVTLTSPVNRNVLIYDTSIEPDQWVNSPINTEIAAAQIIVDIQSSANQISSVVNNINQNFISKTVFTESGQLLYGQAANTPGSLTKGSNDEVLTVNAGNLDWRPITDLPALSNYVQVANAPVNTVYYRRSNGSVSGVSAQTANNYLKWTGSDFAFNIISAVDVTATTLGTKVIGSDTVTGVFGVSPLTGSVLQYLQYLDETLVSHYQRPIYVNPIDESQTAHWSFNELRNRTVNLLSATNASALKDINYPSTPTNGQVLTWQTDAWVPQNSTGGASALSGLSDVTITGLPITNYVLKWNGSKWIPGPDAAKVYGGLGVVGDPANHILILSSNLEDIQISDWHISALNEHLSDIEGLPGTEIHHYLSSLDQRYLPASGVFSGVVAVQVLSSVDYIDFDLNANVTREEGRLYWNSTYKTLELGTANQTSIMLGQEVVVRVLNDTAQTFTRGQVVYISGTQSNVPTIALATASAEATTHKGLGVLKQTLGPNDRGLMSIFGKVSGIDTSIYNIGDILYLGTTPGSLTNVYSPAPSHPELIGSVITVGTSSTGVVLVQVQHGYEIQELHNVSRTPPSATGQVLVWNNTGGYYAPGFHNDLAGLTTGNPHTQYATLSGATFTGPVNTLSSLSVGTSSTVSPLTLSGALTLYQSSPGTRIYDYRDSSGNNLYYSLWDGSNFHHYYGVNLYHNLNGRQIAFEGNGNVNSRIRITGTTAMWLDPSIDGSTQAFRIGAGTYATSAVPLITTTFATCRTWAWNGSNGSTLGSDMGMTFKQTSAVNDSARFTIFTKLSNGTTKEDFNLLTNGNVGIGSINPSATLHVDSTTTQDILNLHNSGISRFKVARDGVVTGSNNASFGGNLTYFGILSNSGDVNLNRDAADTLAQRRATNSQTFRIYNTYTDASNYERAALTFNTSAFSIAPQFSGTGLPRALDLSAPNSGVNIYVGDGQSIGLKLRSSSTGANLDLYGHPTANYWYATTTGQLIFGAQQNIVMLHGGVERFRISSTAMGIYGNVDTVFGLNTNGYTPTARVQIAATSGHNLALDVSSQWNTSATPTAIKLNITDTSSNSASLLLDLQIGGVSQFKVGKNGTITSTGGIFTNARSSFSGNLLIETAATRVGNSRGLSFSPAASPGDSAASDAVLFYDGEPWTIGQRAFTGQTTQSQKFRIYNAYTNSSNFERAGLNWNASAFEIQTEASGTGIARNLIIGTSGTPRMVFSGTGARIDSSGMFVAGTIYPSNQTTYGIRNASNRIESFAGNTVFFSIDSQGDTKTIASGKLGWVNGNNAGSDPDTWFSRTSTGLIRATSSIEVLSSITANIRMSTPALSATNISGVNSLSATNVTGANIYGTSAYISTVSATTYKNLPVNQRIIPITILNPSSITYYPLFYAKYMANIEEVNSVLVGGTSVTWSVWLASDVSDPTTGTQLYDSKITNSLTTGNTETGVSISEGWVVLEVVGYSGSVGQLQLTFITD